MKRFLCPLLLSMLAATAFAAGRAEPAKAAPDGQRFLFIVDISSSMDRLRSETETAIHQLLTSGISRQMWPGDTFGVWTFNKETSTKFPMQVWDARNSSQLGTIVAAYLSDQEHEKSSNLKQMMMSLSSVIQAVSNLNVLIFSDGASAMVGTPFDTEINAHYKTRRKERSKLKMPFVTTLVVRDGWIVNGSVTIAGERIELPARRFPEIAQKKPPTPAKVIPSPAPPIQTVSPATVANSTPSPAQVSASPTKISEPPAEISAAAPRPRVMEIVTKSNVTVAASPATEASNVVATIAPISPATNISAAVERIPDEPPFPSVTAVAAASIPVPKEMPQPIQPDANLLENALAAVLPAPIPVSAREVASAPAAPSLDTKGSLQGVALPANQVLPAGGMLAFGGVLLGAAAFLGIVALRRPRPTEPGSLITQSMERR